MNTQEQVCCPELDVEKWDKKTFTWDKKPFIAESIPTFFHMPLVTMIDQKTKKMGALAEKANANIPDIADALLLFHDSSAFKSEIYYAVRKKVDGAHNTTLSGTFEASVFDGPYDAIPKYIKKMDKHLSEHGKKAKDYYVHYAYCPKCSVKFGHNYIILFAKV
jgi:hypothetical protein